MRILVTASLLLVSTAAIAQPPRRGGSVFLSPMGEPFRSSDPAADNVGAWFARADRDSDGAISLAEMEADAGRFFGVLDADGNGELGPSEIARYENEVAPEVQLGLQMRGTGFGDWRGSGRRHRRVETYARRVEGAGRYAFLNIPEPVIAADMDLNRGVSRGEFASAAGQRFTMLDGDHDGRLARVELPPLPQPRLRRPNHDERQAPMRPGGAGRPSISP
jgi:hypothetical protein